MSIEEIINDAGPKEGAFAIMMDMSNRNYNAHRLAHAVANDLSYYDDSLDSSEIETPKFSMWQGLSDEERTKVSIDQHYENVVTEADKKREIKMYRKELAKKARTWSDE